MVDECECKLDIIINEMRSARDVTIRSKKIKIKIEHPLRPVSQLVMSSTLQCKNRERDVVDPFIMLCYDMICYAELLTVMYAMIDT